jgi:glucosamine-6-phosphate isomerase
MQLEVYPDYKTLSRATANRIGKYIHQKPGSLVCLASGHTPLGVFECLVEDVRINKLDVSQCTFVGLDEWVGMNGQDTGSCRHMMDEYFFLPLAIPNKQIAFFDGRAKDLNGEVERINNLIDDHGQLDIMLVGIGTNGHLAMNEPGTPFTTKAHISKLAEETITVGQKYFNTTTKLEMGITLGLKNFADARLPILMANGTKKAAIIKRITTEKSGVHLPATIVQRTEKAVVMVDEETAGV